MELYEANRILRSVKSALAADGIKLPPSAETDGLMMLLDRMDCDKFLAPKIKHARAASIGSASYKRAYTYFVFFRALAALKTGISDPVTTVSLTMLHKSLCGDLDPVAGRPRQTEYLENGSAHTDPKYISGSVKSIIAKMNDIAESPNISKEDFAGYLTHYMRELIILHPFDNGSAFTMRIFIMLFCKIKGFALCYYRTSPQAIKAAENAAFIADDVTPLYKVFTDCLTYERTTEKKRTAPRTRREITRDLTDSLASPAAKQSKPDKQEKSDKQDKQDRQDKQDKSDKPASKGGEQKQGAADQAKKQKDGDVLKRAIKLQQKITKLNEQLAELMSSEEDDDE